MPIKKLLILFVMITVSVQLSSEYHSSDPLPLPHIEETLSHAISDAERTLKESILANCEVRIVYHGTSIVPLEDVGIELGNVAIVHLSNLNLISSPFHMTGITPHLRLMSIELNANISLLQVTGEYTVAPEIMNYTSRELISSDRGTLNLTFHDVEISGHVGLHVNDSHLHIHSVDLVYKPMLVLLTIKYKDGNGIEQMMEERRESVRNSIEEPVYKDLADRLNSLLQEQLNAILRNITLPDLLRNDTEAQISFVTATNTHIGNVNDFVDTVLNGMKENISDVIGIPDLEKSFEKRLGFLRITGTFNAKDGWLKSLKTLHRTAPVVLKKVNHTIEISAAMGLSTMEFGYGTYSAKFLRVGPSGRITASVGRNSVSFRARVGYIDDNCMIILEELKVRVLNDIRMKLTGLSPFNWILSKVATSIVNRSKTNIIHNIEEIVGEKIRNELEDIDCSSYFPKPAVDSDETQID